MQRAGGNTFSKKGFTLLYYVKRVFNTEEDGNLGLLELLELLEAEILQVQSDHLRAGALIKLTNCFAKSKY